MFRYLLGSDPAVLSPLVHGLFWLHTETACRRDGALAPCPADLDPDQCLIRLLPFLSGS
jgi:hypothetical protein